MVSARATSHSALPTSTPPSGQVYRGTGDADLKTHGSLKSQLFTDRMGAVVERFSATKAKTRTCVILRGQLHEGVARL